MHFAWYDWNEEELYAPLHSEAARAAELFVPVTRLGSAVRTDKSLEHIIIQADEERRRRSWGWSGHGAGCRWS